MLKLDEPCEACPSGIAHLFCDAALLSCHHAKGCKEQVTLLHTHGQKPSTSQQPKMFCLGTWLRPELWLICKHLVQWVCDGTRRMSRPKQAAARPTSMLVHAAPAVRIHLTELWIGMATVRL